MTDADIQRQRRLAELATETQHVARRWAQTPYYDSVEARAKSQWDGIILPFLDGVHFDVTHVLELAVGHGWMTEILLTQAERVTGVDIR